MILKVTTCGFFEHVSFDQAWELLVIIFQTKSHYSEFGKTVKR